MKRQMYIINYIYGQFIMFSLDVFLDVLFKLKYTTFRATEVVKQ